VSCATYQRSLFPDAEDLGRGVIDAALARNPAELERNQQAS
jgi:hypothetical protein